MVRRRADRPAAHWKPWEEISDELKVAVIAGEDQKFAALGLRLRRDPGGAGLQRAGGTVRGASTLSQQVSKNLFLWSGRSWLRKGLEAWFTGLIECSGPSSGFLRCISTASSGMTACLVPRRRRASLWRERQPVAQQASYLAAVLPNPRVERQPSDGLCGAPGGWIRQQMSQLGGTSYLMELMIRAGRLGRTHCNTLWERLARDGGSSATIT
jgi:monofunctional biosynthetic peptidoglycan transglycosylase